MGLFSKAKASSGSSPAAGPELADEKGNVHKDGHDSGSNNFTTDDDNQAGVKKIEAAAAVWTTAHMVAAYAM